jgi:hypothetical protein
VQSSRLATVVPLALKRGARRVEVTVGQVRSSLQVMGRLIDYRNPVSLRGANLRRPQTTWTYPLGGLDRHCDH